LAGNASFFWKGAAGQCGGVGAILTARWVDDLAAAIADDCARLDANEVRSRVAHDALASLGGTAAGQLRLNKLVSSRKLSHDGELLFAPLLLPAPPACCLSVEIFDGLAHPFGKRHFGDLAQSDSSFFPPCPRGKVWMTA